MAEGSADIRRLATLAFGIASTVGALNPTTGHVLIACSKSKATHRDLARNLYTSPLYRKSVQTADGWGLPFSILSAKHGLLDPNQVIEPYDLTLKGKSQAFKAEWGVNVSQQIQSKFDKHQTLIILAGDDYLQPLLNSKSECSPKHLAPMKGLSLGSRLAFLNECIHLKRRKADVSRAYELFSQLKKRSGMPLLRESLDGPIPKQGVYFFFDDREPSQYSETIPRLVRIGTHGVSAGSVATLRNRLRTHYGTKDGRGNHRASVFRLHVGRALIERDKISEKYPEWGKGQSANTRIVTREVPLERRVSEYIGNLRILVIAAAGASGKDSLRAVIEKQFIALFTENFCPVEKPSSTWLGRFSDKPTIRETGLWNVRDVGSKFDLKFINYFEAMADRLTTDEME